MYEDANLYSKFSEDHQREARAFLEKTVKLIKWDENELVLDIGCGSGDVTNNVLLEYLPETVSHLVGIDFSQDMIDYAKKRWNNDKLIFEVLDIAEKDENKLFSCLPKVAQCGFHKIFSFFCLQWVHDLRQASRNISLLLRPGGEALLVMVVRNGTYTVWDIVAKSEKWSKYFGDLKTPLNPYQYIGQPQDVFRKALEEQGLIVDRCYRLSHSNAFTAKSETKDEIVSRLRSVDPLIRSIPDYLREEYMDDIFETTKEVVSHRGATDYDSVTILLHKEKN